MSGLIDKFVPDFDVNEVHSAWFDAEPADVLAAARAITAQEVRVLGPLMAIRTLPSRFTRRPLELGRSTPFFEQAVALGFIELGDDPGSELVLGAIGRWWSLGHNRPVAIAGTEEFLAFDEPGYAKAAMNLLVRPERGGARLETETRIVGTDAGATRRFRLYWFAIGPFSALIRRGMLSAVRRRLQSGPSPPSPVPPG